MKLTIDFIKEQFILINEKYFNNELLMPRFEIKHVKRFFGQYHWKYSYDENIFFDSVIRISDMFDRSEKDVINTIAHEMIHLYIRQNKIRDTRPHHGRVFYSIADRLNKEGGFNISRTSSAEGCALTKKTDKTYYVFNFLLKNGNYFQFVVNEKHLTKFITFYNEKCYSEKWFVFKSNDDKRFATYPLCRNNSRGRYIDEKQFYENLNNENIIGKSEIMLSKVA